ncbi:MAG TPA: PQQ-binding-like beta-propeller repeat protein [Blastocatellia bacterium]|nr:PQQ-binding-like beta-propeller repeat protein [Blastocatellia bacterium]
MVAVALQWLLWLGVPRVFPDTMMYGIIGYLVGGAAVLAWWLFLSRAPWSERLSVIVLMVVAVFATSRIVHESIANGMMGTMLPISSFPVMSLALVASAAIGRRLSLGPRRALMAGAILLACGVFTLLRTGGITGDGNSDLHWRWTETPEKRILAQVGDEPVARPAAPSASPSSTPATASTPAAENLVPAKAGGEPTATIAVPAAAPTRAEWPGFRGPSRDGVVRAVRIETDWSKSPPVELWRRPVGPGWSSFAVQGDRFYTQEQRGEVEIVSAYNLHTGAPVWRHRDAARFWESNAGAGPRGTPTISNGRVYALGATGILNALDARDGSVAWSRNTASDAGKKVPEWGIASSPLVVGEVVIAAAAGSLAAYDAATGKPSWFGPKGGYGYSSPHLTKIDGVEQIVLVNGPGAIGVAPSDGSVLWKHAWEGDSIVQPALIAGRDLLIGSGSGLATHTGMLRVTVERESGGWVVKERWTSNGLKPYFNDFVVHKGYAFGFDGSILACIDLDDGKRKWKGGRYGHGQLVLLPEQDLLLALSEEGELALVRATPDQFMELARFKAIEGKTWNHPVLVG